MSIQFAHAPSLEEPIHFTFEAMGCMPLPQDAQIFGESIQATGQVVWTLEFERIAGVKFLELSSRSRDQIRYWISSSPAEEAVLPSGGKVQDQHQELHKEWAEEWNKELAQKAPVPFAPPGPPPSFTNTPSESPTEPSESALEELDSGSEVVWEPEPAFPPEGREPLGPDAELPRKTRSAFASLGQGRAISDPQPEEEIEPAAEPAEAAGGDSEVPEVEPGFDSRGIPQYEERLRRGQTLKLKQQRTRLGVTAVLAGLATLGAVAGIIGFVSKSIGGTEAAGGAANPTASQVDPNRTEGRAVGENATPFLVEVLDANNKRSVLWFSQEDSKSVPTGVAQKSGLPPVATSSIKTTGEEKALAEGNREPSHDFSLVPPRASSQQTNLSSTVSSALAEPALGEVSPSPDAPLPGALPNPAIPAPVEPPVRQGGEVQPARLIRARLPDYPQLAKTNHAAGDVTLDALVDESGSVKDVTVISGPVLLRQAAIAALRQWKYEPARLDGQPTKMHLTVTMKFKNNQDRQ